MKKILIVDDAPTVLKMLEFTLSDAGYAVSRANNAEEALAKIAAEKFDMGIFDVNMPGKTGIELTKEITSKPEYRDFKVLILTTEFSEELKAKGKEAGAKAWLVKPFDDDTLLEVIAKLIG